MSFQATGMFSYSGIWVLVIDVWMTAVVEIKNMGENPNTLLQMFDAADL